MKILNFGKRKGQLISPPIGLAFDESTDEIVTAERGRDGIIEIKRFPRAESRMTNVTSSDIYTAVMDWKVRRRLLVTEFSEHTDTRTIDRFISENSKEVIQASLEERSCDWSPAGNGMVTVTDVRRDVANKTVSLVSEWTKRQTAPHLGSIKPRTHLDTVVSSLARTWLRASKYANGQQSGLEAIRRTVAFLAVNETGFAIGIWSRQTGLVCEMQDPFDPEGTMETALDHVCDMVTALISPEEIASIYADLEPVSYLVVSADDNLFNPLRTQLLNSVPNLAIEQLKLSLSNVRCEERERSALAAVIAVGSLLDESSIPRIDLANDVYLRLRRTEREDQVALDMLNRRKTLIAKRALLIPVCIVLGACLAWWISIHISRIRISQNKMLAQHEAEKLKQEIEWRNTAEKNLTWYKDFGQLVVKLREQQPATVGLLIDLNRLWPREDKAWWVSNLKDLGNGSVEIRGKAQSEELILKFVRALESDSQKFSNVRFDFKRSIEKEGPIGEIADYGVWFTYNPLNTRNESNVKSTSLNKLAHVNPGSLPTSSGNTTYENGGVN
jgi:hypothetical protein